LYLRFTCDGGTSPLLLDACNSLPLKTPAQLHAASLPPTGKHLTKTIQNFSRIRRGIKPLKIYIKDDFKDPSQLLFTAIR